MVRYCPKGDGAFEDWVEKCPECGSLLQDREPAEAMSFDESADLVWLATAPNQPEAEMWASTLRQQGIQVLLKAGGPGFGAWASVSMFEHQLYVHRRDLKRAREITSRVLDASGRHRMNLPRRLNVPRTNPVRRSR
jgi:hypothetical protein